MFDTCPSPDSRIVNLAPGSEPMYFDRTKGGTISGNTRRSRILPRRAGDDIYGPRNPLTDLCGQRIPHTQQLYEDTSAIVPTLPENIWIAGAESQCRCVFRSRYKALYPLRAKFGTHSAGTSQ